MQIEERRVVIVDCGRSKAPHAAPAKEIYTSPLFRGGRRYAELRGLPWLVLSTHHGLVRPTVVLSPYEVLRHEATKEWAASIIKSLKDLFNEDAPWVIELHAGIKYTRPIREVDEFPAAWRAEEPLAGLGIGDRLRWYNRVNSENSG